MSVLQGATRPGALDALSLQRCLPWGPAHPVTPRAAVGLSAKAITTKDMRGSGSAGPLHEPAARTPPALEGEEQSAGTVLRPSRPPWGVAKARSDKPGGT